jgi:hypothetical protein
VSSSARVGEARRSAAVKTVAVTGSVLKGCAVRLAVTTTGANAITGGDSGSVTALTPAASDVALTTAMSRVKREVFNFLRSSLRFLGVFSVAYPYPLALNAVQMNRFNL